MSAVPPLDDYLASTYDDEFTYDPEQPLAEQAGRFTLTTSDQAAWAMRKLRRARQNIAERQAEAQEQQDRIAQWLMDATASPRHDVEFFEALLVEWMARRFEQDPKAKTVTLPDGKASVRKVPARVEVDDEVIFAQWAWEANAAELVKVTANKDAIKKLPNKDGQVVVDGEILPCVRVTAEPRPGEPAVQDAEGNWYRLKVDPS
jgi:hypothetical protein